jgi:hypothetical protein
VANINFWPETKIKLLVSIMSTWGQYYKTLFFVIYELAKYAGVLAPA